MLIDFEAKFREYLDEYITENEINDDVLEETAPDLYIKWLDTKKEWLSGQSPKAYIGTFSASELVSMLGEYIFSEVTLPGVLLNRIADSRDKTYPFLVALLKNYSSEKSNVIKKVVVRLIEEMDMVHPYTLYIDAIAASDEKNDYAEACAEELKNAGEAQKENVIAAYEAAASPYAADCFLDILADMPYDERIYVFTLEKFLYSDVQKSFLCELLGKDRQRKRTALFGRVAEKRRHHLLRICIYQERTGRAGRRNRC